ncbi:hypothetical protein J5X84_18960 [Streptosporangiaceae bacterium NEAU-GS5]|nr:hypothetical protein [Streptosporangiaceae bacterium NEAU-GS5]
MNCIKGAAAALAVLAAGAPAAPARADDALGRCYDELRHAVEAQLAQFPGGVLIGPDTVSYAGGTVLVTIHPGSCPFQATDLRSGRTTTAVHLWNEQAGVENHWAFSVIGRWVDVSAIPNKTRYRNGRTTVFWSDTGSRGATKCHSPGSQGAAGDWREIYLSTDTTTCA